MLTDKKQDSGRGEEDCQWPRATLKPHFSEWRFLSVSFVGLLSNASLIATFLYTNQARITTILSHLDPSFSSSFFFLSFFRDRLLSNDEKKKNDIPTPPLVHTAPVSCFERLTLAAIVDHRGFVSVYF